MSIEDSAWARVSYAAPAETRLNNPQPLDPVLADYHHVLAVAAWSAKQIEEGSADEVIELDMSHHPAVIAHKAKLAEEAKAKAAEKAALDARYQALLIKQSRKFRSSRLGRILAAYDKAEALRARVQDASRVHDVIVPLAAPGASAASTTKAVVRAKAFASVHS